MDTAAAPKATVPGPVEPHPSKSIPWALCMAAQPRKAGGPQPSAVQLVPWTGPQQ